jgi:aryl-alcohol dehydrogenase-like predicted oxidoreductase
VTRGATAEGTARWRARHPALPDAHFRALDGLLVSSVGLRTHRGDVDAATDDAYAAAIVAAVTGGINLIDTAVDYRAQRSERAVGRALRLLAERGVGRDEVVVCTKGGYLPFDDFEPPDPEAFFERAYLTPGLLAEADVAGGRHAMTPEWLGDQVARSLQNLGTSHADVYYLQDPELHLGPGYATRLRAAFEQLEREVSAGRIGRYGVASRSGLRLPPDALHHLALADLVRTAIEVAGSRHHFRVVQVPLSLAAPEVAVAPTQLVDGRPCTLLEAARRLHVAVVARATLCQGHPALRLPNAVAEALPGLASPAQRALQFARSHRHVTAALVGMYDPAHVAENLSLLDRTPDPAGVDSLVGRR